MIEANRMDEASSLQLEAAAFDSQIAERVAHGHIPDLRRVQPCHYFYNNPWREPEFAQLDFGDQFEQISAVLNQHLGIPKQDARILEIGCGPGFLSLELARAGFNVVGVDISASSIAVAQRFADEDPWKSQRGRLEYRCADFLARSTCPTEKFNAVIFLGSLHHFSQQESVARRVESLLTGEGLVIVHEPARDRVTTLVSGIMYLCKVLLSAGSNFYTHVEIPKSRSEIERAVQNEFTKMKYESDDGSKLQSVNDNEAGYAEIMAAMQGTFDVIEQKERYSFFHELIGGLRFDHETNVALARFLRDFDGLLCEQQLIKASEFLLVARKRLS